MMKLIATFRNFEKGPKNTKKYQIKLKYNYSIINDFSSKTPSSTYPRQGSLGQIRPAYYFSKEKKDGDNKNNSSFSVYSSSKELSNNEKKKDCGHERAKACVCSFSLVGTAGSYPADRGIEDCLCECCVLSGRVL
jgi:hypothetical protein